MRRASAGAAIASATLLAARASSASPTYPDDLAKDLSLADAPACTLCHEASDAAIGPADTLFARSMEARGLVGGDDADSVAKALEAMRHDDVDSDGDGARDLDELAWGGDPNAADVPASSPAQREGPKYGCASSGSIPDSAPSVTVLAFVVLVAAARRVLRDRAEVGRAS